MLFLSVGGQEHNKVVPELLQNFCGFATGMVERDHENLHGRPFAVRCPNLVELGQSIFTMSQVGLNMLNGPQGCDRGEVGQSTQSYLSPAEYARTTNLGIGSSAYYLSKREGANVAGGVNYYLVRNELQEQVAIMATALPGEAPPFLHFPTAMAVGSTSRCRSRAETR
jgi:hypothetical protein